MKFFFFLLVSTACISCLAVAAEDTPRVENPVTLEKAGSRSQIAHGSLIIDGVRVPETFKQVVVDGAEYVFLQRINRWGEDGYFPTQRIVKLATSDKPVSAGELARGWYDGNRLRPGTPKPWVFVRWAYGAQIVAPASLAALVRAESIEDIDRFVDEGPYPTEEESPANREEPQPAPTDGQNE